MEVVFSNNTILNIQRTFYRVLLLDTFHANIKANHNVWENTTSAVDVTLLKTTKEVEVTNNTFWRVSSTSQNIFVIQDAIIAWVSDWNMNGADPNVVSSAIINFNLAEMGEAYLVNINFTGNVF